jgi:hypothetical protein
MIKLMNFGDFSGFLSESAYNIPGITPAPEGGYEFLVIDPEKSEDDEKLNRIYIAKRNEKSLGLSFLGKNGKERECLWIPKEYLDLKDVVDGILIKIRPYTKWMTNPGNSNLVDDFVEDFADHIETSKAWGSSKMKREAQDDIEILLDVFDHQSTIKSFEECGENQWDATLEDGNVIEITKRNPEDLMASFKIFSYKNPTVPTLTILNKKPNPKTFFEFDGLGRIEFEGVTLGLKDKNPYFRYLVKKCLGTETSSDQSQLYDYFKDFVTKRNCKSDEVKNMLKLLSEFIDQNEINSLISEIS